MTRQVTLAACLAASLLIAACGKETPKAAPADGKPPATTLLIAPEDLRTVGAGGAGGPLVTGSIQPARRADLRAEVAAVVTDVLKDNGEPVRRNDLLVRLDATALRDALNSAQESARAAARAFEQGERQVQRLKTLQAQGMVSAAALEDAEVRRNQAQSELAAAKARVVSAQQQLGRTEVRAPFDGVVSERRVSVGDTVQVGRELLKVIDPKSMRFEGLVSADHVHALKVGQPVSFRVNGFPNVQFNGEVKRVDATASATTRQLEVIVGFGAGEVPRVAGLYAEGRIDTGTQAAPSLAESSIVRRGDEAHVWRLEGQQLKKVAVQLGERDARRGEYTLTGGALAEGDRVLRNPTGSLVDGQPVELKAAGGATTASPAR